MLEQIILPALIIGGIGLLLGAILAVAGIVFKVKVNEKVPLILEELPGANCGGCGYAGCSAYAEAVAAGEAPVSGCSVGGQVVAEKLGAIMGVSADFTPMRAVVRCSGDCEAAPNKYEYEGLTDCTMAAKLAGGPKACSYGCMGLGSCVAACQFHALSIVNGIASVDPNKCTACGNCVDVCPKGLIALVPKTNSVVVACRSKDRGPVMKELCSAGCIGCKICEKTCQYDAISVNENCAEIAYSKCVSCGECAEKCPKKIIKIGQ